jgi:hypothetical protein
MTNASSSNRRPSETALLTGLQKKRHYNTDDERVFLTQQAADAKIAIQHTVVDMQATAKEVANLRWWTQHYPCYAIGTATVLGFMAATSIRAPADHRTRSAPPTTGQRAARPSWTATLLEIVRSIMISTILDALNPKGQPSGPAQATQADTSLF